NLFASVRQKFHRVPQKGHNALRRLSPPYRYQDAYPAAAAVPAVEGPAPDLLQRVSSLSAAMRAVAFCYRPSLRLLVHTDRSVHSGYNPLLPYPDDLRWIADPHSLL